VTPMGGAIGWPFWPHSFPAMCDWCRANVAREKWDHHARSEHRKGRAPICALLPRGRGRRRINNPLAMRCDSPIN
jgi:hypothetical protein